MIRRKQRTFISGIAGLVAAALLASCGSTNVNTPEAAPTDPPALAATAVEKPVMTAVPGPAKSPGQLTIGAVEDAVTVGTSQSTLILRMDGAGSSGELLKGDLRIEVTVNHTAQQHAILFSGLLDWLGVPEFTGASSVGLYYANGETYQWVQKGQEAACVRTPDNAAMFDDLSPEAMLPSFVNNGYMYGAPAGEETASGTATRHYAIDVAKTQAAAAGSGDDTWADTTKSLLRGDIFLAKDGGYVTRYTADYAGQIAEFDLNGKLSADYELNGLNNGAGVTLPEACKDAPVATPIPEVTAEPNAGTPGEVEQLVLRPVSETVDVTSLKAILSMDADGKDSRGGAVTGGLLIEVTENTSRAQRSVVLSGDLLNAAVDDPGLTADPVSQLGLFRMQGDVYVNRQSDAAGTDVCQTPAEGNSTRAIEGAWLAGNPLAMIAGSEDMYGRYLGDETINGIEARHYEIDAAATSAAMLQSKQAEVREGARTQKLLGGDVYVAREGGYVVEFAGEYEGAIKALKLDGNVFVQYSLSELNSGAEVELPESCGKPATP